MSQSTNAVDVALAFERKTAPATHKRWSVRVACLLRANIWAPVMFQVPVPPLLMLQAPGTKTLARQADVRPVLSCRRGSMPSSKCRQLRRRNMMRVPIRKLTVILKLAEKGMPVMQSAVLKLPTSTLLSTPPEEAKMLLDCRIQRRGEKPSLNLMLQARKIQAQQRNLGQRVCRPFTRRF